jgi:ABC-type transporter Mla MlaB component
VLAEMSWALSREVELDALIDYERSADPVFVSGELSAICQYDRRVFDAETLERARDAHRYSMRFGNAGCTVDHNRLLVHLGRVLEIGGEIDLSNLQFLERLLDEHLAHGDAVADCTMLTFIDAGGCRLLREARNGEHGHGHLMLRNTPELLERLMTVFDSVDEAD